MQKTLKDFSDTELKAICYDELAKLEQAQNNIKVINQELASRAQNTQPKSNMEDETIVYA